MTSPNDYLMMIDGEMTAAESGQWLTSLNPANEEEIGRVPLASAADIDRAVKAGLRAQPDWNDTPVVEVPPCCGKWAGG